MTFSTPPFPLAVLSPRHVIRLFERPTLQCEVDAAEGLELGFLEGLRREVPEPQRVPELVAAGLDGQGHVAERRHVVHGREHLVAQQPVARGLARVERAHDARRRQDPQRALAHPSERLGCDFERPLCRRDRCVQREVECCVPAVYLHILLFKLFRNKTHVVQQPSCWFGTHRDRHKVGYAERRHLEQPYCQQHGSRVPVDLDRNKVVRRRFGRDEIGVNVLSQLRWSRVS